jgi:hypothetical protein
VSKIVDEVLATNTKYAENLGDNGNLPLPPSRHFAILTCMGCPPRRSSRLLICLAVEQQCQAHTSSGESPL